MSLRLVLRNGLTEAINPHSIIYFTGSVHELPLYLPLTTRYPAVDKAEGAFNDLSVLMHGNDRKVFFKTI